MQAGAVRGGAAKRTAFADVSNTARVIAHAAKDDSAINGKASYDGIKGSVIHVQELVKPTSAALTRPAQRSNTISGKLTQSTTIIPTKAAAQEKSFLPQVQPAATRKVYPKRSAAVLRDVSEAKSSASFECNPIETAPVVTSSSIQEVLARTQVAEAVVRPSAPKPVAVESLPREEVKKSDSSLSSKADSVLAPEVPVVQEQFSDASELPSEQNYLLALEQQATALEVERSVALASQPQSLLPVTEEYYDEEEEEFYYDDGYNTATGGATIVLAPRYTAKVNQEIAAAKKLVESSRTPEDVEDDQWDTSMVAEYGEEIFDYMRTLEDRMRPNPHYMDNQTECQWSMRAVLMDWLVQVHHRFTLLPETLFLAVNYVDRFLSSKIVSLGKLQLVGATAIFVAAKYEEVNCPSVQEIVYMVDNGYSMDEILKAERFMLSMLAFELGWPGPMSFLRRISKADDYDLETRTLAKYFLEVTIMDERFVGCAPSFTAAGAHCLARLMLRKGDWVSFPAIR